MCQVFTASLPVDVAGVAKVAPVHQDDIITAGAGKGFSHSQIHKAMSNCLRPF